MAKVSKPSPEGVCCLNPVCRYLEESLITDDVIQSLSDLKKGPKGDPSGRAGSVIYTGGTIRPLKNGNASEVVQAIGFQSWLQVPCVK